MRLVHYCGSRSMNHCRLQAFSPELALATLSSRTTRPSVSSDRKLQPRFCSPGTFPAERDSVDCSSADTYRQCIGSRIDRVHML